MNKNIKYLIEDIVNFNVTDYQDNDLIDSHTVTSLTYKYFPKTKDELREIIRKKVEENKLGTNNIIFPDLYDIDTSQILNMAFLFDGILTDMLKPVKLDLSSWRINNLQVLNHMFYCCNTLVTLDLFDFNAPMVITLNNMFFGCNSLKQLDLSGWDTSNIKDTSWMFQNCKSLFKIDLSGWDTSNITNMCGMFMNCLDLESIDVSGFNVDNVINMSEMFYYCHNLKNIKLFNINTNNEVNMRFMFYHCISLTTIDLSGVNINKRCITDNMFTNCDRLENIITYNRFIKKEYEKNNNILSENTINFNIEDYSDEENDIIDSHEIDNITYYRPKTKQELQAILKEKINEKNASVINKENPAYPVYNPDLSDIDVSAITDMGRLFWDIGEMLKGSRATIKLDLSKWDTSNVTDMSEMFSNLLSVTDINLSGLFNTSKVYDMKMMFSNCRLLTRLDLSNFDTNNVLNMKEMFLCCESLLSLNISSFKTHNVLNMSSMFKMCESLTELDLSNFTIEKLGAIYDIFENCKNLKSLKLSKFNTSHIQAPLFKGFNSEMFKGCDNLLDIDTYDYIILKTFTDHLKANKDLLTKYKKIHNI